jgi:hypothetical protein
MDVKDLNTFYIQKALGPVGGPVKYALVLQDGSLFGLSTM